LATWGGMSEPDENSIEGQFTELAKLFP
jgi:hypothetical protein